MGFIDSYKNLEKLCGDILNDDRRLSAYIDEMNNISSGSYYVKGWKSDLKRLKHYRWIRNQIVHEPDCTEQNMCESDDALWLDSFYFRILNQTDPLALYYKAMKSCVTTKSTKAYRKKSIVHINRRKTVNNKSSVKYIVIIACFVCILLIVGGVYILK